MKRLHVHVAVENIGDAVTFYTTLFGTEPVKLKPDYAKWMLEDPRVNFAISARGRKPGLDHLGIQVQEDAELSEVRERIQKAEIKTLDEGETTCCYAKADKTWVIDPAGIAWEAYKTMGDAELFGKDSVVETKTADQPSCGPSADKPRMSLSEAVAKKKTSCC